MQFYFDRSGFPLVEVPRLDLAVHLLPVTKIQFEKFLAEPNEFGNLWYEKLLKLNPRVPFNSYDDADREKLFITGVQPQEALSFAKWMSKDNRAYDLPTDQEWRAIYKYFSDESFTSSAMNDFQSDNPVVGTVIQRLEEQLKPQTILDFCLMTGGLVEWVKNGSDGWSSLGAPRNIFYKNAWQKDPLSNKVRSTSASKRIHYQGFRLVARNN